MKGVIGIDEVGRGPLAGPVTVCAVYLVDSNKASKEYFNNIVRDSKRLSLSSRINIFQLIRKNRKIKTIYYAVSSRSAKHVDKHGINKSIHDCMISCLSGLEKDGVDISNLKINLDGGLKITGRVVNQEAHIRGDEKFVEIALASIVAKVTRDSFMIKLAKLHPEYGFERNVGYGTLEHRNAIKRVGITDYHRKTYLSSFKTIRKNLK